MAHSRHREVQGPLDFLIDSIEIRPGGFYTLLNGADISLAELSKEEIEYLQFLVDKASEGTARARRLNEGVSKSEATEVKDELYQRRQNTGYFKFLHLVRGLGAYPLKGSIFITEEIQNSTLFKIADDILSRVGIHDEVLKPSAETIACNLLTVQDVAKILGYTDTEVRELLQSGRLKGERYGQEFIILQPDLKLFLADWRRSRRKNPPSPLEFPNRIFSGSDCHGGQKIWNPLESPDIVARLAESIRSDLSEVHRFDTFGVPEGYHQHVVSEAVRLHRENPDSHRTGLFLNSAPRTEANKANGQPFYRAEFDENIVVVATPLSVLSGVRNSVRKLLELPNEHNGLYDGKKEQHRSSFTPRMLAKNHGLKLKEIDRSHIPELPRGCRLANVDRFGNLVISETGVSEEESIRAKIAGNVGKTFKLGFATLAPKLCDVTVVESLSDAAPGSLAIYENDGNIEVVSKWYPHWDVQQRLDHSAYKQFREPAIGNSVFIR